MALTWTVPCFPDPLYMECHRDQSWVSHSFSTHTLHPFGELSDTSSLPATTMLLAHKFISCFLKSWAALLYTTCNIWDPYPCGWKLLAKIEPMEDRRMILGKGKMFHEFEKTMNVLSVEHICPPIIKAIFSIGVLLHLSLILVKQIELRSNNVFLHLRTDFAHFSWILQP